MCLQAARLHLNPGGFSLLHEVPAAWDTRHRGHSVCTERYVKLLACHQLLFVVLVVACPANMPGLGS